MKNAYKKISDLFKNEADNTYTLEKVCNADTRYYKITDLFICQNYSSKYKLFFNQDSIGFVLETPPITLSSKEISVAINKLFKHLLPTDSKLQVMLFADPYTDNCLNRWKALKKDSIMEYIAKKTFNYLQKFAFTSEDAPYFLRDFRYIISFSIKSKINYNDLIAIQKLKNQIKHKLEALDLQILEWGPKELLSILSHIVSLDHNIKHLTNKLNRNELEATNNKPPHLESNLDAKLEIMDHQLIINANNLAIKTYQTTPKMSFWSLKAIGQMIVNQENDSDLSQIPCPFIISYQLKIQSDNNSLPPSSSNEQEKLSIILLAQQEKLVNAEKILLNLSFAKKFKLQENASCHLTEFLNSIPILTNIAL